MASHACLGHPRQSDQCDQSVPSLLPLRSSPTPRPHSVKLYGAAWVASLHRSINYPSFHAQAQRPESMIGKTPSGLCRRSFLFCSSLHFFPLPDISLSPSLIPRSHFAEALRLLSLLSAVSRSLVFPSSPKRAPSYVNGITTGIRADPMRTHPRTIRNPRRGSRCSSSDNDQ
jgi:hypothetical protein